MKSILIIGLILLLASCQEIKYPKKQTKFIIENNNKTSIYLATPLEIMDLNVNITWFVDDSGKFNIGDTVSFELSR